jgi:glutaminase
MASGETDKSGPIDAWLAGLLADIRPIAEGKPAAYIPELAKVDPSLCGIAIATVDGAIHGVGDWGHPFTIQSISKAFVYGHALQVHGRAAVLEKVGVEPTGESFNSILLDNEHHRPFNPMVNAGAIATAELIEGEDPAARRATLDALMADFAGHPLTLDEATYLSEKETGHRNRAIAWMMLSAGMIERDPEEVLDLYFRQCSLNVTCGDLAVMGTTLANAGVNPITGMRALAADYVPDVLTVMNSCGMYNYAGQWAYEIGLPAKSGVSGAILAIIPGQGAVAVFSPPIDERGNSVRGVEACRRIADEFGLHLFRTHPDPRSVIRHEYDGGQVRSKRVRTWREREILFRAGRRIRVIEVQDALFFGSTERLLRRAAELAREADYLILDVRNVVSADVAACKLLIAFIEAAAVQGDRVIFAHLGQPLQDLRDYIGEKPETIFESRDFALQYCEDRLIAEALPGGDDPVVPFEDLDIFRGLSAAQIAALHAVAELLRFGAGERIAHEGEQSDRFFVLARGDASIRSTVSNATGLHSLRLSTIGPGMCFGERALIDGGQRLADVIADSAVEVWAFPVDRVRTIGAGQPEILVTLLGNMAADLSERLQLANAEIRAFAS